MPTLPRVDFQVDSNPGQIVACLEINAAQRLGGYSSTIGNGLMLPVELMRGYTARILMLSGMLRFAGDTYGLTIPAQPLAFNDGFLQAPISDEQVRRIEERRSGEGAIFELLLKAIGIVDSAPVVLVPIVPTSIVVPRDEWIKVLAALGFGLRRLIELPAPPQGLGSLWDAAAKQIEAASWRLAKGDSRAALTEARIALERTLEAAGDAIGHPRSSGEPFTNFAKNLASLFRSKHVDRSSDPYAVLADAIHIAISSFGFASTAAHNAIDAGERAQAELALSVATTVYSYLGRMFG